VEYSIWLPPTYDPGKTYPVLYLLHGYEFNTAGAQNGWLEKGSLNMKASSYVRDNNGVPFIIVTPNGLNSFYINSPGGMQYETFFLNEFIPYIEKNYGGNGKRAIAGLSMGGFGSLYHGMLNPQLFTYIYACSPATGFGLDALAKTVDPSSLPKITIETGTEDTTVSYASVLEFTKIMDDSGISYNLIARSGGHTWPFWTACLTTMLPAIGNSFK